MPENAHPDSTFSSHVHNDWTYLQMKKQEPTHPEYPTPEQRGPIPENAHPDKNGSFHLYDNWTYLQTEATDYPVQDQRPIALLQAYNGVESDKRMFPEFEDAGDYVQLKSSEYPGKYNVQNMAQGEEGFFHEDKRLFAFEDPGDYV